jgi:uncharacterized protein (TIGR02001 family)
MIAMLAAALLACEASADAFSIEAEAAIVSDYRWRGLSLSDEDPSLQLEAAGAFDNGAWMWAGLNTVSEDYGDIEIGLGLGYDATFAALDWSLGVIGYLYPDADDLDYFEIDLSASKTLGMLSLSGGVEYAPEQDNYETDNPYFWLGADARFGRFNLHSHVGQDNDLIDPAGATLDYSIGASVAIEHWSADLSFVESEADDSIWVLRLAVAR